MKSLFGGSAACAAALVLAAMLFYAQPSVAVATATPQETKSAAQTEKKDTVAPTVSSATILPADALPSIALSSSAADVAEILTEDAPAPPAVTSPVEKPAEAAPMQDYVATAYSLPGRGASGVPVARGTIAADPRVLPFGTRVRIDAGQYSGEYVVTDAGGGVKGRKIDIWMPNNREACRFGRRNVKLTVLSYGPKRTPRARR